MGAARRTLVPGFKPRRTRDNSEGGVRHESPSELPSSELSGASEQNRARTYKRSVEVYVWACSSARRNDHCRLSALALIGTNSRALHPPLTPLGLLSQLPAGATDRSSSASLSRIAPGRATVVHRRA